MGHARNEKGSPLLVRIRVLVGSVQGRLLPVNEGESAGLPSMYFVLAALWRGRGWRPPVLAMGGEGGRGLTRGWLKALRVIQRVRVQKCRR